MAPSTRDRRPSCIRLRRSERAGGRPGRLTKALPHSQTSSSAKADDPVIADVNDGFARLMPRFRGARRSGEKRVSNRHDHTSAELERGCARYPQARERHPGANPNTGPGAPHRHWRMLMAGEANRPRCIATRDAMHRARACRGYPRLPNRTAEKTWMAGTKPGYDERGTRAPCLNPDLTSGTGQTELQSPK
jgi:hypothetical protein